VPDSTNEKAILVPSEVNTVESVLQGTETYTVLNKNTLLSMNVYLNNVFVSKVVAGSGVNIRYLAVGFSYSIKCSEVADPLASQTQAIIPSNCGGSETLNFNP
jgi:hypothetical protein